MKQQALALAFVAMLAAAMLAPVSATSALTVESPTELNSLAAPDFQTAPEWTDGTTVDGFQANDSKAVYVEQNTTSTNPAVRIIDNETDTTLATWENESLTQTYADGTADDYAYRLNLTHGDLADLDIQAGETKNITVRYVNNASKSMENETYTNVSVELTAASTYSNYRVDSSLISSTDLVSFNTDGFSWGDFSIMQDKTTEFAAENVSVNGSGSMVGVDLANTTAQDRLSASLESVTESNWDKSTLITIKSGDDAYFVKGYTQLPDDVNRTSDTYAIIDESSNSVDVNFGDRYNDTDSVDEVVVKTNVGMWDSFARGMGIWMQENSIPTLSDLNPLAVVPTPGFFETFSGSPAAIASLAPVAVGRRQLA